MITQDHLRFLKRNIEERDGNSIKRKGFSVGSIFLPTSRELKRSVEMTGRDFAWEGQFLIELLRHLQEYSKPN